jgi:hypothetical protein
MRRVVRADSLRAAVRQTLHAIFQPRETEMPRPMAVLSQSPSERDIEHLRCLPEFAALFAQTLEDLLASSNPDERRACLAALPHCRHDPKLADEALERLLHDGDEEVARAALEAFDSAQPARCTPRSAEKIREFAKGGPPRLRTRALYLLCELPSHEGDAALVAAALDDEDERVRIAGAYAQKRRAEAAP